MTPRRASIAALVVATFALLYAPVMLFGIFNISWFEVATAQIGGAFEKSLVVVTAVGACAGFALAARGQIADAQPIDRIRARRAIVISVLALLGAGFWWFVLYVAGEAAKA